MNPSLANRLRIGFAITFALLAGVTVIGVGRLFQLRQDFEDKTTRSFQLEIAGEHLRQAFLVEQASLRGAATDPSGAEVASRPPPRRLTRGRGRARAGRARPAGPATAGRADRGGAALAAPGRPADAGRTAAPARTPAGSRQPGHPGRRPADRQSGR